MIVAASSLIVRLAVIEVLRQHLFQILTCDLDGLDLAWLGGVSLHADRAVTAVGIAFGKADTVPAAPIRIHRARAP